MAYDPFTGFLMPPDIAASKPILPTPSPFGQLPGLTGGSPWDPVGGAPVPSAANPHVASGYTGFPEVPQGNGEEGGGVGASSAASGGAGAGGFSDKLLGALRGIKAPPPADVVKPSTPGLPRQTPIQGGQLLALLNQISNPNAVPPPRYQTLGGALGTGRY